VPVLGRPERRGLSIIILRVDVHIVLQRRPYHSLVLVLGSLEQRRPSITIFALTSALCSNSSRTTASCPLSAAHNNGVWPLVLHEMRQNSQLHEVQSLSDHREVKTFIRLLSNKVITVNVPPRSTCYELKRKINDIDSGSSPEYLYLVHRGRWIPEDSILRDHKIVEGSLDHSALSPGCSRSSVCQDAPVIAVRKTQ
jgi:hypothetical protein